MHKKVIQVHQRIYRNLYMTNIVSGNGRVKGQFDSQSSTIRQRQARDILVANSIIKPSESLLPGKIYVVQIDSDTPDSKIFDASSARLDKQLTILREALKDRRLAIRTVNRLKRELKRLNKGSDGYRTKLQAFSKAKTHLKEIKTDLEVTKGLYREAQKEHRTEKKKMKKKQKAFTRSYTGKLAVFRVNKEGKLEEMSPPITSASHTGQFNTDADGTPDVDGDNVKDIAYIRDGHTAEYRLSPNRRNGRFVPTEDAQAFRDTNHNGRIDMSEKYIDSDKSGAIDDAEQSEDNLRLYKATAIQIHEGTQHVPVSVGCITMPPDQFEHFTETISQARELNDAEGVGVDIKSFTYVLSRHNYVGG